MEGAPTIREAELLTLLKDAASIDVDEYSVHCEINVNKTCYYICYLASNDNSWIRAPELCEFIKMCLERRGITKKARWNPDGFLGKQWTHVVDGESHHIDERWLQVIERDGEAPYSYRVRPEYIPTITLFFARG